MNLENKYCVIILARGGSKGIPGKNIKKLKGRPLISYTIEAALGLAIPVWVSSDCDHILNLTSSLGASPFVRNSSFASDISPSEEALIEFCKSQPIDMGIIFIQPTSPLLLTEDLLRGIDLHQSCDSVLSVYREHWVPRWSLKGEPNFKLTNRPRRQDKEEVLIENGAFYISKCKNIMKSQCRYSGKIKFVEMPLSRSFQIDTLDDWELIENLL